MMWNLILATIGMLAATYFYEPVVGHYTFWLMLGVFSLNDIVTELKRIRQ